MKQTERWLDLINLLSVRPGQRAEELAERYGCSVRTIQRDIAGLRKGGFPIENQGGYRLSCEAFLPPLNLTPTEFLALLLAAGFARRYGGKALGAAAESAMLKIQRRIPTRQRRTGLRIDGHLAVGHGSGAPQGAELLPVLSHAIEDRLRVRLRYQALDADQPGSRTVDPWGLFFCEGAWYLQAFDHLRQEERNFRLSRICDCQVTKESFEMPPAYRAEAAPRHRWDFPGEETTLVRLRVKPLLARWLGENPAHPSQRLEGDTVVFEVRNPRKMVFWILSLEGAEVREPAWLRQAVAERARALMLLHGGVDRHGGRHEVS